MEPHELIGVYSSPSNSMLGICIYHLISLIHKFGIFAGIVKAVIIFQAKLAYTDTCVQIRMLFKNTASH